MSIAEDIVNMTKKKKLHFSLIDPDKQNPELSGSIAKTAEEAGSSAIMVGGSTLVSQKQVDDTVKAIKGAPFVKNSGVEPISMGYVIVEPGMTAGRIGEVDLIKKDDIETAVGYALASQYLGMKLFYLEAGSGASSPVSNRMIKAVKQSIDIPLIVGGGIRAVETARQKAHAGADIIITGTKLEEEKNLKQALTNIIKAIEE